MDNTYKKVGKTVFPLPIIIATAVIIVSSLVFHKLRVLYLLDIGVNINLFMHSLKFLSSH
jgi:hypothetical protein